MRGHGRADRLGTGGQRGPALRQRVGRPLHETASAAVGLTASAGTAGSGRSAHSSRVTGSAGVGVDDLGRNREVTLGVLPSVQTGAVSSMSDRARVKAT